VAQPALHDIVNVTVKVLDSNDNEPVFERARYELSLYENQPRNTRILTVRATDADLDADRALVYGMTRQSRHQLGHVFRVDNKTGDVYVIGQLDRESTPEYIAVHPSSSGRGRRNTTSMKAHPSTS